MGVSPVYSIHEYDNGIFKIVAFKGARDPDRVHTRNQEEEQHYNAKLNEAFCCAKSLDRSQHHPGHLCRSRLQGGMLL